MELNGSEVICRWAFGNSLVYLGRADTVEWDKLLVHENWNTARVQPGRPGNQGTGRERGGVCVGRAAAARRGQRGPSCLALHSPASPYYVRSVID